MVGIGLDFRSPGVEARPVRVGLEGVGVGEGGNIHRKAGVGVDMPSATEILLAVEHQQGVKSHAPELDGGAHAAEAGTHNNGLKVGIGLGISLYGDRKSTRMNSSH